MAKKELFLSDEQLGKLIAKLSTPDPLLGTDHLNEDDFAVYVTDEGTVEEKRHISVHLEECAECAQELKQWRKQPNPWQGEQGRKRLEALTQRLLNTIDVETKEVSAIEWHPHVADLEAFRRVREGRAGNIVYSALPVGPLPIVLKEAAAGVPPIVKSPDQHLSWQVERQPDGSVAIMFSSRYLRAGSKLFLFQVGAEAAEVLVQGATFQIVSEVLNEVGATIRLPPDQVRAVSEGHRLLFDVVSPEGL